MWVILKSNNLSLKLGVQNFKRFRERVVSNIQDEYGEIYISNVQPLTKKESKYYLHDFTKKIKNIRQDETIPNEIVDFLFQPLNYGKITSNQANVIYEIIKNYNDNYNYGSEITEMVSFEAIKQLFKDCAENGGKIKWKLKEK